MILVAVATAGDGPAADDYYGIRDDLATRGAIAPAVEPDLRTLPWHTVRRLALLGGEFVPPYQPVSAGEITDLLTRSIDNGGPGLILPAQRRQLAWLLHRHGMAGAPVRWSSCACKTPQVHVALGGRLALHELGPGDVVTAEAGLGARGLVPVIEPDLAVWSGRFWGAVTLRLAGSAWVSGREIPDALRYDGWPMPTGRPAAAAARTDEAWRLTAPRAVVGARMGAWSVSAGRFPAAVGPGLDGSGLTLSSQAGSVPQVVARRTRPFAWSGFMRSIAPEHLLLRAGATSEQTILYRDSWGRQQHRARPVFCQWLVAWRHTPWWRTTLTHAVMAAPRRGNAIWADLPQINVPMLDATWTEVDYGPVTDRIFTVAMELRFRDAPWPLLPRAAGRVWWEYGGEDFRPHDVLPGVPEISAPASLAGVELVGDRWDVAVEYQETRHQKVLWYGNSGFAEGYSHDGVGLGSPLGGGVEAWTGLVRIRPASGAHEWTVRGRTSSWEMTGRLPDSARRRELELSWRGIAGGGAWTVAAAWIEEEVGDVRDRWLQGRMVRLF